MIRAGTDRRLGTAVLALFLLTLPLEFTSALLPLGGIDLPQVVLALGLAGFGVAILFGRARPRLPWTGSAGLIALLVLYAIASALVFHAPNPRSAILPLVGYPLALALVYNLADDTRRQRIAWISILASAAVISLVAILLRATDSYIWRPEYVEGVIRINATFADPDILARFVCFGAAAGLIFFAHERAPRTRSLAFASVLLCSAVVPLTYSRAGVVLWVAAIVLGVAAAEFRRPAAMLALLATVVFALVVMTQPSARSRVANIFQVIVASIVSKPFTRPSLSFNPPGGGAPLTWQAKACSVQPGMDVVSDPQAVDGNTMEIRTGTQASYVALFGTPTAVPAGSYRAYVRLRVSANRTRTPELHLGVWDPGARVLLPNSYTDLAPSGFSDEYAWLELGTLTTAGQPIQFFLQTLQPPTADWFIDNFALLPVGGSAGRTRADLAGPWGATSPAAVIDATAGTPPGPGQVAADPLAAGGRSLLLPAGTAGGYLAGVGRPVRLPAGVFTVYAHLRSERLGGSAPQLIATAREEPGGGLTRGRGPGAGSGPCTGLEWVSIGELLTGGGSVQVGLEVTGKLPAGLAVDRLALVPAPPAGALPMVLLAASQASEAGFPWWEQLVYRLPLDDQRRYLIAGGIQMFIDHPAFGVGYGRFQVNLLTTYRGFMIPGYRDSLSHTSLVSIAAELGLAGLLLTLAAIGLLVRDVRRVPGDRRRRIYVLAPGLLLLLVFLDSQFEGRLLTEPYLWVLLALLYAARRAAVVEEPDRPFQLVMLTHYFPPEVGAPQSRLYELAVRLARAGTRVTVVTGFPNYPTGTVAAGYRGKWYMSEEMEGVRVLRTWVVATPNRGFALRLLNHISFAVSSLIALPRLGPIDVLFIESPPLFLGIAGITFHLLTGAPYIFNVSDVWPQSAVELGALRNPAAIAAAKGLELLCYRWARYVTVVTRGILENLAARGVPRERLFLLTNGVDTSFYRPLDPDAEVRASLGLKGGEFAVLYAGTHGLAQGLDVVLDAARLVKEPSVRFVLVGEGAEKETLVERARQEGIGNVLFVANQPRSRMPAVISAADAAIIPLRPLELFRSALPSKMFEAMAAARPIVLSVWGEAAGLIEEAGSGITVPPGDAAAIAAAVDRLAGDPALARRLGKAGRAYVSQHYDREALAARFAALLESAAAQPDSAPAPAPAPGEPAITS